MVNESPATPIEIAEAPQSCIYTGRVRHRRYQPRQHEFSYQVFMMFLRLDDIDRVLSLSRWWSRSRWALARFRRDDYFDRSNADLEPLVKTLVLEKTGKNLTGPVFLLTNCRYFGYIVNPLSVYYCYDNAHQLQALVLEVTNTPWNERHHYVINCDPSAQKHRTSFNKDFHVSPFNPMDMLYRWQHNTPSEKLHIHMENWIAQTDSNIFYNAADPRYENSRREKNPIDTIVKTKSYDTVTLGMTKIFDATLQLEQEPLTGSSLNKILLSYPLMTGKVLWGIYWQALKLFCKRVPFFGHPGTARQRG